MFEPKVGGPRPAVAHDVPSMAIGRSRGGNQHSLSEWADIASAKTGTQQLIRLLVSM